MTPKKKQPKPKITDGPPVPPSIMEADSRMAATHLEVTRMQREAEEKAKKGSLRGAAGFLAASGRSALVRLPESF